MLKLNQELLKLAEWRLDTLLNPTPPVKEAFVPAGAAGMGDPAAGGAPPSDPSMDPSAGGGAAPPTDPSGGGGGGMDPMTAMMQQMQALQQQVQQLQAGGMGGGGMPGAAAGPGGKPAKADLNMVALDGFQTKKLVVGIYHRLGWDLPPDIIDGPNRDPSTGMPMPLGAPGSTSDPNRPPVDQGQAGGGQAPDNALQPPQPMQPASLSGGAPAGAGKMAEAQDDPALRVGAGLPNGQSPFYQIPSRASAVAALLSSMRSQGS